MTHFLCRLVGAPVREHVDAPDAETAAVRFALRKLPTLEIRAGGYMASDVTRLDVDVFAPSEVFTVELAYNVCVLSVVPR